MAAMRAHLRKPKQICSRILSDLNDHRAICAGQDRIVFNPQVVPEPSYDHEWFYALCFQHSVMDKARLEEARQLVRRLAVERGPSKSFCPSEAARLLADDWRVLMPVVRRALALESETIMTTRKGQEVAPETPGGPIRARLRTGRDQLMP